MPKSPSKKKNILTTPFAIVAAFAVVSTSLLAYTQLAPMLTGALQLPSFNWSSNTGVPTKIGTNTSFGNVGTTAVAVRNPLLCIAEIDSDGTVKVTMKRGASLADPAPILASTNLSIVVRERNIATQARKDIKTVTSDDMYATELVAYAGQAQPGFEYSAICTVPGFNEVLYSKVVSISDKADLIITSLRMVNGPAFEVTVKNVGTTAPTLLNNTNMRVVVVFNFQNSTTQWDVEVTPQIPPADYNGILPTQTRTYVIPTGKGFGMYKNIKATVNYSNAGMESPTSNNSMTMADTNWLGQSTSSSGNAGGSSAMGGAGSSCGAAPATIVCLVYSTNGFFGSPACVPFTLVQTGVPQTCTQLGLYENTTTGASACSNNNTSPTPPSCTVTATLNGGAPKTITLP